MNTTFVFNSIIECRCVEICKFFTDFLRSWRIIDYLDFITLKCGDGSMVQHVVVRYSRCGMKGGGWMAF